MQRSASVACSVGIRDGKGSISNDNAVLRARLDPSGNALEFKAFRDIAGQLFAT
jgi:extradiol dioxygenase family protein